MNHFFAQYYRIIVLLSIQCFFISNVLAQNKFGEGLKFQANYHQGVIIPEFGLLAPIDEDYRRAFEFSLSKQSKGKNSWAQLYNYPEYGLSFFYASLGHDKVLGKMIGIDYFFKINFLDKNRFKIFNQTNFGVSYANRKFDEVNNPLNIAVGSHVNIHFNFRLGTSYYLSEKNAFQIGVSFDHISNGTISYPNLGINSVSLFGGITHNIGENIEKNMFEVAPHERKTYFEIITDIGWWHWENPDRYYFTPSVSFEVTNETFRLIHFGIGADLFYDESVKIEFEIEGKDYENIHSFQGGVHLSQAIVYDRFKFILQEGLYVITAEELDRRKMYHRVLFKYNVSPKISIHLSFKTYLQELKYSTLGVGYKL